MTSKDSGMTCSCCGAKYSVLLRSCPYCNCNKD